MDEEEGEDYAEDEVDEEFSDGIDTPLVTRDVKEIKLGKKIKKDSQLSLRLMKSSEFELPPLTLLAEPKRTKIAIDLSDDVLEQNARMLEGVLEDFGVRGQIINVKPGPVVTRLVNRTSPENSNMRFRMKRRRAAGTVPSSVS